MKRRFWLRLILGGMAVVCAASWGISGALALGLARRSLLARLAVSFGRPVDVGHFEFSLLSGPRLEADSVTVSEDPRFGQEYFLRAAQLRAGLRWTALLRGRVEFGTLSLIRPSLNLVHTADGHWNIESWLPSAREAGPPDGARSAGGPVAERLQHIDVNGGRINFKMEADKLPFALIDVSGHIDHDRLGRWSLDLTANPMRTSVALQDAGMLRLRGTIAGTSERLWPAALTLSWDQASLADAMRLSSGRDYGVRGLLAAELTAKIEAPAPDDGKNARALWTVGGTVQLAGVHRWDLVGRATNPAVNLSFDAAWRPGERRVQISHWVVASTHSRLDAVGAVDWVNGFHPHAQVVSSHIAFDDLLAWQRAFRANTAPNIVDDLSIEGSISVAANLADWPPRIEQADIASKGAVIRTAATPGPLELGPIAATMKNGALVAAPVSVTLPGVRAIPPGRSRGEAPHIPPTLSAGSLLVEATLGPFRAGIRPRDWEYRIALSGETQRTQDLVAVAQTFWRPESANAAPEQVLHQASDSEAGQASGRAVTKTLLAGATTGGGQTVSQTMSSTLDWIADWVRDWRVSGPAAAHLVWTGALHRGTASATGTLDLRGIRLSGPILNQPVVVSATIELRPGERRITVASAEALGTQWKGSLRRRSNEGWTFDLSADHLDAEELDRWLGPRARPSLFARMLPFAARATSEPSRATAIDRLNARGRLRVAAITLEPLRIEKLDAGAELRGGSLMLRGAQATFYGGHVAGDFEARLSADPQYTFQAQIDRANLAALTNATESLAGRFAGFASGELRLAAQGIGRDNLLKSLEGEGTLRVREPVLTDLMPASVDPGSGATNVADVSATGEGRFGATTASFHIGGGRIRLDPVSLVGSDDQFEVEGNIDFTRRLDLRVESIPRSPDPIADADDDPAHDEWVGAGTLDAPRWTHQTRLAGAANGSAASRAHR